MSHYKLTNRSVAQRYFHSSSYIFHVDGGDGDGSSDTLCPQGFLKLLPGHRWPPGTARAPLCPPPAQHWQQSASRWLREQRPCTQPVAEASWPRGPGPQGSSTERSLRAHRFLVSHQTALSPPSPARGIAIATLATGAWSRSPSFRGVGSFVMCVTPRSYMQTHVEWLFFFLFA